MSSPEEVGKAQLAARTRAWCIICFGLGLLLTNYPILQIFNQPLSPGGIPLMVAYLLGIWLVGIVILFILTRLLAQSPDKD